MDFVPEGFVVGVIVSILTLAVIILMASIRKGEASFFGDYDDEEDWEEESLSILPEVNPSAADTVNTTD